MTIKETQELIKAWSEKSSACRTDELIALAGLNEKIGELERITSMRHGAHAAAELQAEFGSAASEVMWTLFSLANSAGIDLTQAIIDNLEQKNAEAGLARGTAKRS